MQRKYSCLVLEHLVEGCKLREDPNVGEDIFRFGIIHEPTGLVVIGPVSDYVSVFAGYTDEYAAKYIRALAPRFVKN
jgi:hypothetical protein